jgi:TPR repeat protein
MSKHLIYVVALALSIAVAACVTQSQPTQVGRTSILAADAWQRGKAAYDRRDYMKAFREWLPLAQQGNAFAQHYLGVLYAEGLGVTKDEGEAVRWYRLAAAQGFIQAYYNLGIMGFQALAPEKVRLADNDGLMPRDESEGVFPEKVPFRERFLCYSTYFQLFENV